MQTAFWHRSYWNTSDQNDYPCPFALIVYRVINNPFDMAVVAVDDSSAHAF